MMKAPPARERVVGVLEKGAFFLDLENAERDAGKNVIALRDPAPAQFLGRLAASRLMTWTRGSSANCRSRSREKAGSSSKRNNCEFASIRRGQLAGMDSFARAIFGNHARLAEIHFARHPLHKRL